MAMISSVQGLSGDELESLHPHLLSTIVTDNENAEPHLDGRVASLGGELRYDRPQFPEYYVLFSLDRTHFQTPSDIPVLSTCCNPCSGWRGVPIFYFYLISFHFKNNLK